MLKVCYKNIEFDNSIVLEANELIFDKGITVLVGENGSGKTTILNMLYREILEGNTQLFLDDTNLSKIDLADYRNTYITYVSQNNIVFEQQSVSENLEIIVANYTQKNLNKYAKLLMLEDVIKRNPKVHKLSGGEKQKLKLLCGLLSETPILLLDEPFNNLDSKTIKSLNKYLVDDKRYLIVTSHIELTKTFRQYEISDYDITSIAGTNNKQQFKLQEPKVFNLKTLKLLRKNNRKVRYPLYVLNLIIGVFFILSVATTLQVYNQATIDRSNFIYGDTATMIKSPITNSHFLTFGDEKWLETTPAYFGDEDISKLESLDYVETVIPVKGDGYGEGSIDYHDKYILDVDSDNSNTDFTFSSALYPKQVAENLPPQVYGVNNGQVDSFEVGTFPEDDSTQAMIDTHLADYILDNSKYSSYDDLIGQTITFPVVTREGGKASNIDFEISGVFNMAMKAADSVTHGVIVPGFEYSNRNVQATYSQFLSQDEIYTRLQETLSFAGLNSNLIIPEDISTPAYDSLYIETKTPEDVETLTKEISDYNQYIEIENNYAYSKTMNFKYLNRMVIKNLVILGLLICIFIMILRYMFKLYKQRLNQFIDGFKFYAYSHGEIQKFIKFELNQYLATVGILNLLISSAILFTQYHIHTIQVLIIVNVILMIANYSIVKITFRRRK